MAENLERAVNRLTARIDKTIELLQQQGALLKKLAAAGQPTKAGVAPAEAGKQ